MNQCKECGMGYCPNRIKRVFGYLPAGFCSPQCFTKNRVALSAYEKKQVADKFANKVLAGDIIDFLTEEGYFPDHVATDPDKFAGAVETVERFLNERKERK